MVKKSSFLERLFGGRKDAPERPGQRPRAKVERDRLDEAAGVRPAAPKRVDPQPQAPIEVEPLAGLEDRGNGDGNMLKPRTGKREEAVSALTDGFRDLSSLLHGVQDRMDEQSRRTGELNEKFVDLPVMAKAQVDFLSRISEQMLKNQERTAELVTRLSGLPELLDGIHRTLEKQVASEERTEKTLGDFRTTMDRIHTSIGTLTRESTAAMNTAVESFERNHDRSTQAFAEVQKRAHDSFEKSQEAYLAQIRDFVDRGNKVNRNMVWLMVMVLGALVVLFVAVLNA